MSDVLNDTLVAVCTFFVLLSTVPVLAGLYQYAAASFSVFATHLERTDHVLPRIAVLVPAWNEVQVISTTIDRLLALNYPPDRLRVYVVDDASNDGTDLAVIDKMKAYPARVVHIRRVAGGEGKAHTLNYGLDVLWAGDWCEAVLIMDADVIYTAQSLQQMARHLADPEVGAVTAYIKEGSGRPNLVQRFIGFEYITATAASRRAQNVMGFLACLSGGAQLHTRENLMAIGGKIFSDTLAEDTFTTFRTQLYGKKAIFEPNAIVYAEEPDSLDMLWKQRLRWARGNVQITRVFRELWFHPRHHARLGSLSMAVLWFSIFLMPVFQTTASISLVVLFFSGNAGWAWGLFRGFWILAGITYLIVTFVSLAIDVESAARTWKEGVLFPGLVSLSVIVYSLLPVLFVPVGEAVRGLGTFGFLITDTLVPLFLYVWLAGSMGVAYLGRVFERYDRLAPLAPLCLLLGGYGPFLCAVTVGSYFKELSGAEMKWDKTVKTGKVG